MGGKSMMAELRLLFSKLVLGAILVTILDIHLFREKNSDDNMSLRTVKGSHKNASHWAQPPLSELIEGSDIRGDVQYLLDFAIIGHSKTATTSLMHWLVQHPEIQMEDHEVYFLQHDQPADFVKMLYEMKPGQLYKRGYKSPNDIRRPSVLKLYEKYWPNTRLIVGLRHPVKWFQSYYNFKSRVNDLPPAEGFTGWNLPPHINYHVHLSLLGKTPREESEQALLNPFIRPKLRNVSLNLTNPVFLYEISQPYDPTEGRNHLFARDLSNFLGLEQILDAGDFGREENIILNPHYSPIDVCDSRYTHVRQELMNVSRAAATWIREYFMDLPDVFISSSDHFRSILDTWMDDPCEAVVPVVNASY